MPYIHFQDVKRQVSIEQAAEKLGLQFKREQHQLRGSCPACNGEPRTLAITPQKQMFYCFAGKTGGDQLALVCHVTGIDLKEAAEFLLPHARENHGSPSPTKSDTTAPARPAKSVAPQAPEFDAEAFAGRLTYSHQVAALGITEADATRLGIGFHAGAGMLRGRVCIPLRDETGKVLGYMGYVDGSLKFPKTFLPSNVVRLRA